MTITRMIHSGLSNTVVLSMVLKKLTNGLTNADLSEFYLVEDLSDCRPYCWCHSRVLGPTALRLLLRLD